MRKDERKCLIFWDLECVLGKNITFFSGSVSCGIAAGKSKQTLKMLKLIQLIEVSNSLYKISNAEKTIVSSEIELEVSLLLTDEWIIHISFHG